MGDVIQLLAASALGTGGTLAGMALQAHLQRKHTADDRAHNERQKLIDKAEEILRESETVDIRAQAMALQAHGDLLGVLRETETHTFDQTSFFRHLVLVHFPECEHLFAEHSTKMFELISGLSSKVDEYPGPPEGRVKFFNEARYETASECAKATITLTAQVRREISLALKTLRSKQS